MPKPYLLSRGTTSERFGCALYCDTTSGIECAQMLRAGIGIVAITHLPNIQRRFLLAGNNLARTFGASAIDRWSTQVPGVHPRLHGLLG